MTDLRRDMKSRRDLRLLKCKSPVEKGTLLRMLLKTEVKVEIIRGKLLKSWVLLC